MPASAAAEGEDACLQSAVVASTGKMAPSTMLISLQVTPPSPATATPTDRSPIRQSPDAATEDFPGRTDAVRSPSRRGSSPDPDGLLESVPEDDEVDSRILVSALGWVRVFLPWQRKNYTQIILPVLFVI